MSMEVSDAIVRLERESKTSQTFKSGSTNSLKNDECTDQLSSAKMP